MANYISIDGPAYANILCPVPASTPAKTFINLGGIRGLTKDASVVGANGLSYATVGTVDVIGQDAVPFAFAVGAVVYITSGGAFTSVATGNTAIGVATRVTTGASAPAFVALTPGALTA